MKTVIEIIEDLDTPVKLEVNTRGKFRVTYGKDIKSNLSYNEAAEQLGFCIFHSLQCLGALDHVI